MKHAVLGSHAALDLGDLLVRKHQLASMLSEVDNGACGLILMALGQVAERFDCFSE